MITFKNINLRRGPHLLLKDVNWTIYSKQRIGLIGANGSGKSSLFAMLLGEIQADAGDLEIPKKLKFAHVAQETPGLNQSAIEYVLEGDNELKELQKELTIAEQENNGIRIGSLHARLGEIDAYTATARAAQLLNGLGFSQKEQLEPVSAFSGGWRVRLNLAKALMCRSDILLLDEPTNHLDLDAVIWLENWLTQYPGTLLLISHDREFLDHTVHHIAHITDQHLKCYTGNYSTFEKSRAAELLLQQASYEKQQKQIAHLQSFINRFKAKASKARQAQSRIKAIERMEIVSAVHVDSPFQFHFKEPGKCANPLLLLEDAGIAYGAHEVLRDINISITPNDRIALIGPNGAGKTSLIKLLAGELATQNGKRQPSAGLKTGYFAQHQIDHLHLDETPLDHMRKLGSHSREQELRTYLGSFGFSTNRVLEKIKSFSGGEKSRLALALLIWQKPNLLLLDEPTNHLDLEMRHALSMALQEYQGAMILVSHDRFLIKTTADQLMLVANHQLTSFDGDLQDYERWLFEFRRQQENIPRKKPSQKNTPQNASRQPLLQTLKKLETELEKLKKEAAAIENILSENTLYEEQNKSQLQQHLQHQIKINKKLQEVENAWLAACEELDNHMDSR